MQTILITGATGFIGSHLLRSLENKDFNIIVLKRSFSNISRIEHLLNSSKIKFYNIDKTDIENVFVENHIDTVINCVVDYGRNKTEVYDLIQTNLMLPIKILDLCVKYNVSVFINTDSYYNKDNLPYSYAYHYPLSKKSLNLWLKYFSKQIKIIDVILEHVYGEDDNNNKFIPQMIDRIVTKQENEIALTQGEQYKDFIYVDDVVNAYVKLLEFSENNNFEFLKFNIGTGEKVKLKDFVEEIKLIAKSSSVLKFGVLPYGENEIMESCANIAKIKELGWAPQYTYKEGLAKIINNQIKK